MAYSYKKYRSLAAALLVLASFAVAADAGELYVNSNPDGANVSLEGASKLAGVTPVTFDHLLYGNYKLEISRYGYETFSTRLAINPAEPRQFSIDLKPKTRFKASIRSLVIPGWGQRYFGKRGRGNLLTALALVSAGSYFWIDHEFDKKYDTYQDHLNEYDKIRASGTLEELRAYQPILDEAQQDAYDYDNIRRGAIGVMIGVWSINMLDILFSSAPHPDGFDIKGISLAPSSLSDGIGLTLSRNF